MQFFSKMFKLFLTEFRIHFDNMRDEVQSTLALHFAEKWGETVGKTRKKFIRYGN